MTSRRLESDTEVNLRPPDICGLGECLIFLLERVAASSPLLLMGSLLSLPSRECTAVNPIEHSWEFGIAGSSSRECPASARKAEGISGCVPGIPRLPSQSALNRPARFFVNNHLDNGCFVELES